MHSPEVRQECELWLQTPKEMRHPKTKATLCRKFKVTPPTLNKWENELPNAKVDSLVDQLASLEGAQLDAFMKRVYQRAMEPGASAKHMELFAKLKGLLIDKSVQVNVDIPAEEYFRIRNEARRELEEEGYSVKGVREVCSEQSLLPQEIWKDTGQD